MPHDAPDGHDHRRADERHERGDHQRGDRGGQPDDVNPTTTSAIG
jgi:hypothetical protein